jgi:hypothetical protein
MEFLVEHFTVFGVQFQYWMPIVGGSLAVYIFYLWKTGGMH